MRNEDFILLHFLKFALSASPAIGFDKESADREQLRLVSDFFKKYSDDMNWTELIHTADRHSVLSLLYDTLTAVNVCAAQCETQNSTPIQNQTGSFIPAQTLQIPQIPQDLMQQVQIKSTQIVLQNYRLLYYSSFLITLGRSRHFCPAFKRLADCTALSCPGSAQVGRYRFADSRSCTV